jgi:hypothetical protein
VGDELVAVNDEAIANLPLSRIQARFIPPLIPPLCEILCHVSLVLPSTLYEQCNRLGGEGGGGLMAMFVPLHNLFLPQHREARLLVT